MKRSIADFQKKIEELYGSRDHARGVEGTFVWFMEEVGELARCFIDRPKGTDTPSQEEEREFADCFAWLITLASLRGIDLEKAAWDKYGQGCPRCLATPCNCAPRKNR